MSAAERHWTALDRLFSRLLPAADIARGRTRFSRRAAALNEIYMARMENAAGEPATSYDLHQRLQQLRGTHRALASVLSVGWNGNDAP